MSLYNSLEYASKAIAELLHVSLIVIDDGSIDGSSEWLKEHYPAIHLLRGDGNLWWTGAINMGAHYAVERLSADHIILWNDDTECSIDYFLELGKLLKSKTLNSKSLLASKVLWTGEGDLLFNFGCFYSTKTGIKKVHGFDQKDCYKFQSIIPIDWSGGMGTIIPAAVLRELNYFDNVDFPQYHADIDFFLRAKSKGYTAYAIPSLRIYNNRSSTGIAVAKGLTDFKKMFFSNQSNANIKQNFIFNKRHSNTLLSWINLFVKYCTITGNSFKQMIWS